MRIDLEANEFKRFFIQHSKIQGGRILFLDKKFNGKLCDPQNDQLNSNKLCGYFSLKPGHSNIISMHSFFFHWHQWNKDDDQIKLFEFSGTFTKGNLSLDIRVSSLQPGNYAYDSIVDAFDEFFELDTRGWMENLWMGQKRFDQWC